MIRQVFSKMVRILYTAYGALEKTIQDDGIEHAGYMSFMVLLTLFPFIVFIFTITGFIGDLAFGRIITKSIVDSLPPDALIGFKVSLDEILNKPPESLLTLAICGAIWTSSSFLEGVRTILNRVHEVSLPPSYLWRRFLSIIQFFILTFILITMVFLLILLPGTFAQISEIIHSIMPSGLMFKFIKYIVILFPLLTIVSLLYYIIPNRSQSFKSVLPGSLITVVLWTASGGILNFYISFFNQFDLIYGSLAKIIVSLLFFFIVNMIFIYGAAFNHLWKKQNNFNS